MIIVAEVYDVRINEMWWTRSSTFPHQRKLFSSLVLGTERHWGECPFTKWKRGESPDQECKWPFRHTERDSNPHYSLWVQWRFWLLLLLAKCNWDMTCTGGPSVYKNEDGGRTASAGLSLPCCLQRRAYTTATNLGDVLRYGMCWLLSSWRALSGHWEGIGKPAALTMLRRLEKEILSLCCSCPGPITRK